MKVIKIWNMCLMSLKALMSQIINKTLRNEGN